MNVTWSNRTASSSLERSIIHVIRNDEVAIPSIDTPCAPSASVPRRTLSNEALIPVPTTLMAPSVSLMRTPWPKRAASASRTRASSCRFSREMTSVRRSPLT